MLSTELLEPSGGRLSPCRTDSGRGKVHRIRRLYRHIKIGAAAARRDRIRDTVGDHERACLPLLLVSVGAQTPATADPAPNIVLILADDMGYGDVRALNPASSIPTPHLDGLAAAGMSFTDAHTPSAVCTPTRYGALTGRYCWRGRLKRGVINGYGKRVIEDGRKTIGDLLSNRGYETGIVGKWHLGLAWPKHTDTPKKIDFTGRASSHLRRSPPRRSPSVRPPRGNCSCISLCRPRA